MTDKITRKLYCISYDIDKNESELVSSLKKISDTYYIVLPKVFLVYTDKTDVQIFDILQPLFENGNGRFFIAEVEKSKMNGWLSVHFKEWLNSLPS